MTDRSNLPSQDRSPGSRFTRNFVIGFAIIEAMLIFGALFLGRR